MTLTKGLRLLIVSGVLLSLLPSCDNYTKIAKRASIEQKYQYAISAFEKGQYNRALPILEELISVYRGTANGEKVLYYYAYCNYNTNDFILAAYHFKSFVKQFPTSAKAEECAYMNAYCYYLTSPAYSLDQTDTKLALKELQNFVNLYPKSSRLEEANSIVTKLRAKLELKGCEIARQYYSMYNYKSAIVSIGNFVKDFPDSKYVEEMNFVLFKSHYFLTMNSIDSKKPERLKLTIESYLKFIDKYPQSPWLKDAELLYNLVLKMKDKYKITLS